MLRKITYYRDEDNNIIRDEEKLYFLVPKGDCPEFIRYGDWIPYKKGIREINDFIVYKYRDSNNRGSGWYKVIKRVRDKMTGEMRQSGGYYRMRDDR